MFIVRRGVCPFMKELTSRQQQALATKQKIWKTAMELLQNESYDRLTMNRIASTADISIGALYYHFRSKEELFFTGYLTFDAMIAAQQNQIVFDSPVEAIRSVIYAQSVGAFLSGANYIASIMTIQLSSQSAMFYNDERAFPNYVYQQAEKAVQAGELKAPEGSREIARAALRIARGCIFDCAVRNQPEAIGVIVQHDLDMLLSHYHWNHPEDIPPVSLFWLDTYRQWKKERELE